MTAARYENHIIREPFIEREGERIFTYDDRDGIGVTYEYRCIDRTGWSMPGNQIQDGWELLCFLGGDPMDIMDIGGTVRVNLGEDNEEHGISSATVVSIPPGLKHGPVTVSNYIKPFVFLRIATTKDYEDRKIVDANDGQLRSMREGAPITRDGKKYWPNIIQGPFFREREPGYNNISISAIHNEYKSGTTLGYHCIYPSYLAPTPHSHTHSELLCFLGSDPKNVKELNAKVTVCLGEEQEEHSFTTATIVSIPSDLKHCPVTVKNATKPVIFLVICTTGEKVDVE